MDTGRFFTDAAGIVARQTIKLCPGIPGAAARNDAGLLQLLPLQALWEKDGYGRTAAMLAAIFNSWDVLQQLLQLPGGIDWAETHKCHVSNSSHV